MTDEQEKIQVLLENADDLFNRNLDLAEEHRKCMRLIGSFKEENTRLREKARALSVKCHFEGWYSNELQNVDECLALKGGK